MNNFEKSRENLATIVEKVEFSDLPLEPEVLMALSDIRRQVGEIFITLVSSSLKQIEDFADTILEKIKTNGDFYLNNIESGIKEDTHEIILKMLGLRSVDHYLRRCKKEYSDYFDEILLIELNRRREIDKSEEMSRREFQKELEERLLLAIELGESIKEVEIAFTIYVLGLYNLLHSSIAASSEMLFSALDGKFLGENDEEKLETIVNILGIALSGVEQIKKVKNWIE